MYVCMYVCLMLAQKQIQRIPPKLLQKSYIVMIFLYNIIINGLDGEKCATDIMLLEIEICIQVI